MMIFREYFYCNYMWTAEKLKSLKKIKSPTVESELFQISNNLELLFVLAPTSLEQIKYLDYSQFENVHFLTVGEKNSSITLKVSETLENSPAHMGM